MRNRLRLRSRLNPLVFATHPCTCSLRRVESMSIMALAGTFAMTLLMLLPVVGKVMDTSTCRLGFRRG